MGLDIGRLLYGIRTKYQISVNDICRGICGVSTYCMYENDEMIPDILSVNMFLDRMGFGTLGVSAYISKKEAVYFQFYYFQHKNLIIYELTQMLSLSMNNP